MESFTRTVEIVLKESVVRDASHYRPEEALWAHAVRGSGYLQARIATTHGISVLPNIA